MLLNIQHYKVRIKGEVEQSREWSSALPYTAIEKGAFGSPSTKVANFTFFYFTYWARRAVREARSDQSAGHVSPLSDLKKNLN